MSHLRIAKELLTYNYGVVYVYQVFLSFLCTFNKTRLDDSQHCGSCHTFYSYHITIHGTHNIFAQVNFYLIVFRIMTHSICNVISSCVRIYEQCMLFLGIGQSSGQQARYFLITEQLVQLYSIYFVYTYAYFKEAYSITIKIYFIVMFVVNIVFPYDIVETNK